MAAVIRILLFALVASMTAPAGADDGGTAPAPAGPPPALFDFVRRNPVCTNFTDNCVICRREGDRLNCSTPAIACVTAAPVCTDIGEAGKPGSGKAP
jgi:hypothetical protein